MSAGGPPTDTTPARAWRFLLPAGLAELLLLAALGWWPGAHATWPGLLLFAGAFAAYALAAVRIKDALGGGSLIWIFAVGMRLALIPLQPDLSLDAYRYLWDGHVQASGMNPFRYAPSDPELAGVRTSWFALVPEPDAHTPYPPLAQLAFLGISLVGGAVLQAKLLWLGFDLATAWVLGRIAAFTGRSRRLTQLLYLWSPLLVVEVAWSAHLVPMALFGLALLVLLARAPTSAGAAGALSTMVAPVPLFALPPLARRLGWRFLLGFAGVAAALTLPYARAGGGLLDGIVHHVQRVRFLEGPFLLFESALPGDAAPRWAAAAAVLGMALWLAAHRCRPERILFWVIGAALVVTPVLEPWYALWILPFAALRVSRPWLLFTGLAFFGYVGLEGHHASGVWPQPVWARLLVWLPLLAMLTLEWLRGWRERFPDPEDGRA